MLLSSSFFFYLRRDSDIYRELTTRRTRDQLQNRSFLVHLLACTQTLASPSPPPSRFTTSARSRIPSLGSICTTLSHACLLAGLQVEQRWLEFFRYVSLLSCVDLCGFKRLWQGFTTSSNLPRKIRPFSVEHLNDILCMTRSTSHFPPGPLLALFLFLFSWVFCGDCGVEKIPWKS